MRSICFAGNAAVVRLLPCLFFLACHLMAQTSENESGRNLVILVDRSKSVEAVNLQRAISLVSGMTAGEVTAESRQFWKASKSNTPAGEKLMRIFKGDGGFLAAEDARLLLGSVGNYQRTAALRQVIADDSQKTEVGRKAVGGKLLEYVGTSGAGEDLSTHLTLPFSIVFGESERLAPCYLVVISDFNEDCFNSPISEYDGGVAQEALRKKNEGVFGGNADFKDGEGASRVSGKYDDRDVQEIVNFRKKFPDPTAEMEFTYTEKVEEKKHTPLNIKIYSTDPVRSVRFKKDGYSWILPGEPPEIVLQTEGIRQIKLACGKWSESMSAEKEFPLPEKYLKQIFNKERKDFPFDLDLLVESSDDRLEPVRSQTRIQVESAKIQGEGPFAVLAGSKESVLALPDESTSQNPKSVTQFEFKGKLVPSVPCKLDALLRRTTKGDAKALEIGSLETIAVEKDGSFSFTLADFADGKGVLKGITGDENEVLEIEVYLPESESSEGVLDSFVYRFSLPALTIFWPFGKDDRKVLEGFDRIALSASHAGIPGFEWSKLESTPSGPRFRNGDIDFEGVSPGIYEITAVFGKDGDREVSRKFSVEVPKKSPWFLYMLGTLGISSILLFSYHFVKSRR